MRDRDRKIRREIEDHLELEAEALERDGHSRDDARRQARLRFGNPAGVQEDVRAVWAWVWLERLAYDLRHAVRLWLASPGLSTVAIATMALGIGASTAIVGQINAVFWTPLAVAQPQQLRQVTWTAPRFPYVLGGAINVLPGPEVEGTPTFGSFSYQAFEAMRDDTTAFSDVACWADFGEARPVTLGELGFGAVQFVSGNYFRALGVDAAIGRTIQPGEDGPETWAPVAMIGHRFWQRVFGGDSSVTSRTLTLNGRSFAIVGVVPESFTGLDPATVADVILPIGAAMISAQTVNPLRNPGIWAICRVVGRLRAQATESRARAELEHALAASIATTPPQAPYDPPRVLLAAGGSGIGTLRDAATTPLAVLLAGVGLLLLAACANLAGLLLARSDARRREIATRLALGAPRLRLVRQLITESLVLACAGGLVGVVMAYVLAGPARRVLSQFMPTLFGSDRQLEVVTTPDLRVLGFAVAATLVAGLLFGVVPALRATQVDLIGVIRQVTSGSGRRRWAGGRLLVAVQTALAVLLLVSTGMFLRTVVNLRAADLGFATEHLLYARVEPRSGNLPQNQRFQFFETVVNRIGALPGVTAAAAAIAVPYGGDTNVGARPNLTVCLPGAGTGGPVSVPVDINFVSPGYFRALGVELLAGRDLAWTDPVGPQSTAIMNEALARHLGGIGAAVGHTLQLTDDCAKSAPLGRFPIVGVVRDYLTDGRSAATPTLYWSMAGTGMPTTLLVRTTGDPSAMIASVRKAVTDVNADIPTFSEAPLSLLRERSLRRERLLSGLLGIFAIVTALVSALGIYGMLAYDVSRRRAEIGIRMAIGADARAVVALIVSDSVLAVVGGIAAGLVAASLLHRLLASMFYGVGPGDPLVLAIASGLFVLVAVGAAAWPARSATRVNPVLSLRL